jgi:hypothetical protein
MLSVKSLQDIEIELKANFLGGFEYEFSTYYLVTNFQIIYTRLYVYTYIFIHKEAQREKEKERKRKRVGESERVSERERG